MVSPHPLVAKARLSCAMLSPAGSAAPNATATPFTQLCWQAPNGLPGGMYGGYPPPGQPQVAPSIFADVLGASSIGMADPPRGSAPPKAAEGTGRSVEDVDSLLQDPFANEEASQAVRAEA